MSINSKVKGLLALNSQTIKNYATFTKRTQANVSNKISRNSWNVHDFLLLAKFTNTKLAFIDEQGKTIIIFDEQDLEEKQ